MWPFTTRADRLADILQEVLVSQQATTRATLECAKAYAKAADGLADAVKTHLKLFDPQGRQPQTWKSNPEAERDAELAKQGFPLGGTESEQLNWVLSH